MKRQELIQQAAETFGGSTIWTQYTNDELAAALEQGDQAVADRMRARRTGAAMIAASTATAAAPVATGSLEDLIVQRIMASLPPQGVDADEVERIVQGMGLPTRADVDKTVEPLGVMIRGTSKVVQDMVDRVDQALAGGNKTAARRILQAVTKGQNGIPTGADPALYQFLFRHCAPGNAVSPVSINGEQGSGKTYTARLFAKSEDFDLVVEVGGFSGMESIDLYGRVGLKDGAEVWMDGPLVRAFRAASEGKKVCLIIDEILRIPARERDLLLTALTPDDGLYRISFGRVVGVDSDGLGTGETIEAPTHLVSLIATTNVGADFHVSADDPAMRERWKPYYIRTCLDTVERVIASMADAKGWPEPEKVGKAMRKLTEDCRRLRDASQLALAPTLRTLCRAVEVAPDRPGLQQALEEEAPIWCESGLDGFPVGEQLNDLRQRFAALVATLCPETKAS